MSKHIPIDAETDSRVLDSGLIKWRWTMPWACRGCQRFGTVEVVLPPPEGTRADDPRWATASTNAAIQENVEREHHGLSPFCVARMRDRVVGRVYRIKGGEKVYLRAKGEREEDIRTADQRWPPWTQGG